jgi:hypothetical protein
MFLAVTCQHASGACQSHSRPVLNLREASRKYVELSPSTPLFLTLGFYEKDLMPTPNLLQISGRYSLRLGIFDTPSAWAYLFTRVTRGRSRKRYRTSRKSTDENDDSQTGQGEEIATPPAQCTSPRRGTEMNSSNPLQTENSVIGNDIYCAASAVSPNANHQVPSVPLFTVDHIAKPVPNAAQTLQDQQFEDQESQELFLQCLTPVWHRDIHVFAR